MTTVASESSANANINSAGQVTVYSSDGVPVSVDSSVVDVMLKAGFSLTQTDPDTLLSDLAALIPNLLPAWAAYLSTTKEGGVIDTTAMGVAHAVIQSIAASANNLHLAIHKIYPIAETTEE